LLHPRSPPPGCIHHHHQHHEEGEDDVELWIMVTVLLVVVVVVGTFMMIIVMMMNTMKNLYPSLGVPLSFRSHQVACHQTTLLAARKRRRHYHHRPDERPVSHLRNVAHELIPTVVHNGVPSYLVRQIYRNAQNRTNLESKQEMSTYCLRDDDVIASIAPFVSLIRTQWRNEIDTRRLPPHAMVRLYSKREVVES